MTSQSFVYVNGQVARGIDRKLVGGEDPVAQARQAFGNIRAGLEAAGALDDIVQCRVNVVDCAPDVIAQIMTVGREVLGKAWKPSSVSVLGVQSLGYPIFKVEVEATATIKGQEKPMAKSGIQRVRPNTLPPRVGDAAQVLVTGHSRLAFVNSQLPLDENGKLVGGADPVAQSVQVFRNVKKALAAAGATGRDVVHYRITVVNYDDSMHEGIFGAGEQVFKEEWFDAPCIVFGATALEKPEFLVSVEVIAALND